MWIGGKLYRTKGRKLGKEHFGGRGFRANTSCPKKPRKRVWLYPLPAQTFCERLKAKKRRDYIEDEKDLGKSGDNSVNSVKKPLFRQAGREEVSRL